MTSQPLMSEEAFYELVKKSRDYPAKCQARLKSEFAIESHKRFDWDQAKGQIVFSDAERRPRVLADFEFVGTLSKDPKTWLVGLGERFPLTSSQEQRLRG